ncbi:MAG TPA: asparaginase domain-containing protein [bacterium]|jgi:L-asparaginase|nr:asparaginase domain-containing protein [bacterium]HNT64705.1 asparaginase domain-containing protein [bacterium]HOX85866.1 asparaginase domain-containing protein [bacterium]HPG45151.1 asparaginase domain-containing protein [bacterium]HPM97393.1 asparaginase domain-containing protein [bacterium]
MKRKLIVITTGGTIEKSYDEVSGTLSNRGSVLFKLLKRLRLPDLEVLHRDLFCKDSLDMTDKDRQMILLALENALADRLPIIILHGTDTMAITAQYLYDHLPELAVPVVMTGAMKPFGFEDSDALQNFTEALAVAFLLSPGVYISMHCQVHPLPGVRKNRDRGTFESGRDIESS